jgi:signal transduction histidine kinase
LDVAAVVLDRTGGVRAANGLAAACLGRSQEELAGLSAEGWAGLLGTFFARSGSSRWKPLDSGDEEERTERLDTAGYPRRVFQYTSRLIRDEHGRVTGRLELLRNVTDLVKTEEERARAEARHAREMEALETRLEQAEKFKMDLTANVTHDLRTPIASIKATVSGLRAGDVTYDASSLREALAVIEEEADRLQRRVTNLLSMARVEAGDAVLTRDWVDVTDVIASSLESLRSIRGKRPVTLEFEEDLPLVLADYDQLQIAVRNLIENAFHYSPPGAPVEISAGASLGQLRVRVRDHGPGLMPDEFERVFEKFYRGLAARRIPGTGLGLPICRGVAEAHGGHLWAEHVPGGGVAFVLSLPVQAGADQVEIQ